MYIYSRLTSEWFKKIENKSKSKSIQFDIMDFNPLISKILLQKTSEFNKAYVTVTNTDIGITFLIIPIG